MSQSEFIEVEFIDVRQAHFQRLELKLPKGKTIQDLFDHIGFDASAQIQCGIFGEIRSLDYILKQNDRVEIYSPLIQDPKTKRLHQVSRTHLPRRCR